MFKVSSVHEHQKPGSAGAGAQRHFPYTLHSSCALPLRPHEFCERFKLRTLVLSVSVFAACSQKVAWKYLLVRLINCISWTTAYS